MRIISKSHEIIEDPLKKQPGFNGMSWVPGFVDVTHVSCTGITAYARSF